MKDLKGVALIGESINDSIPSTQSLLDANDMDGILALARAQDAGGADYIDVNVGRRSPDLMAELVKRIQTVTDKPLSIDTPDPAIAEAGLKAYDPARCGGQWPILNSISPQRLKMLDLFAVRPMMPILLISERHEGADVLPNRDATETVRTAVDMLRAVRACGHPIPNERLIIDPGLSPLAVDSEGMLKRVIETMTILHADPEFKGIHFSVGLSNFSHMLPSKRADGSPVRGPLESAFLTRAIPLGLDMIVGSVKRKYRLLEPDHAAMTCLDGVLKAEGIDAVQCVRTYYRS